jgi:probable phosphoglycerate mutase
MRLLYLIRHATPAVQPNVPAVEWPLSDRGIEEARGIAAKAEAWGLQALYASREAKARSTALVIGDAVGLPVNVVDGLEELRIDGWISNADAFADTVRRILEEPDVAMRGAERAADAAERFAGAIQIIEQGAFPAALASHGRVISAWLAASFGIDEPFAFWRSIPMPGWTAVDLDDRRPEAVPHFLP